MPDNLLSKGDLVELTGKKHRNKQKLFLDVNQISFIERADGSLLVAWHSVYQRLNPKIDVVY